MLTNFDLEDIAHNLKIPIHTICMKDKLPSKVRDGNYIINLQSSFEGSGTHWTGLVVKSKNAIFFDPFGTYPSLEIRYFVKRRRGTHLAFTTKDIQDLKSNECGLFVMGFLKANNNSKDIFRSTEEYLSLFPEVTTEKNDVIIKNYVFSTDS